MRPPSGQDADSRAVIRGLREKVNALRHSVPRPGVLRSQLPYRLAAVRRLAARPDARARHESFQRTSAAYARAVDAVAEPPASARVTTLDSLEWWVPLMRPDDPVLVERALAHQDFPYRVIVQTREVSIGGAMIDIGANIGLTSVSRVILGDAAVAYCAEPDPLNYQCLLRNAWKNGLGGLVLPDHVAIGAAEGTVRLLRAKSAGGHRVLTDGSPANGEVVEVPCLPLDKWVERVGIDLDDVRFIKVDVQGSEVDVLRGAAGVLSHRHIAWQIEVDHGTLAARGMHAGTDLYPVMQQSFTHFIDLNRHQTTARVRPIGCLPDAMAYVDRYSKTDVLLFNLDPEFSAKFA